MNYKKTLLRVLLKSAVGIVTGTVIALLYPTFKDAGISDEKFIGFAVTVAFPTLFMSYWLIEKWLNPDGC